MRKYLWSDTTRPTINGQQLTFRTVTVYDVDNNGKVTNSSVVVYYTPFGGGRSPSGEVWNSGTETSTNTFKQGGFVAAAGSNDKGKTFVPLSYTQDQSDAGLIPVGKKVGDPILSKEAVASLNTPNGVLNKAINNSVINKAANTQPGLAKQLSSKLDNTATGGSGGDGVPPDPNAPKPEGGADITEFELPVITEETSQAEGEFGNWRYPMGIEKNEQDFIKFTMLEYTTRTLGALEVKDRVTKKRLGTVILPIQPSISDLNTVDWQGEGINALQIAGARFALAASSNDAAGATAATVDQLVDAVGENGKNIKEFLRLFVAGQAVNVNLLSRVGGAVVNPNLELLFNGPQLRPFTFTYRLSARNKEESARIRSIIRFFKQGMAVRKAKDQIFLKTPNIFEIKYCYKGDSEMDHPGLNKIKLCALTSCNVDYTPDGSYATFSDGAMTSYGLTLQFTELEPVYSDDYKKMSIGENTANSIGY